MEAKIFSRALTTILLVALPASAEALTVEPMNIQPYETTDHYNIPMVVVEFFFPSVFPEGTIRIDLDVSLTRYSGGYYPHYFTETIEGPDLSSYLGAASVIDSYYGYLYGGEGQSLRSYDGTITYFTQADLSSVPLPTSSAALGGVIATLGYVASRSRRRRGTASV